MAYNKKKTLEQIGNNPLMLCYKRIDDEVTISQLIQKSFCPIFGRPI